MVCCQYNMHNQTHLVFRYSTFRKMHYTGWSESLCAPYDYNKIVRCPETFWSPCRNTRVVFFFFFNLSIKKQERFFQQDTALRTQRAVQLLPMWHFLGGVHWLVLLLITISDTRWLTCGDVSQIAFLGVQFTHAQRH